jgi:allantoinase
VPRAIVSDGLVVTPEGALRRDVLIEDGRIAELVSGSAGLEAEARIDASGLVVLPGAIDGHTHFIQDDPENTDSELAAPHPDEFEGFGNGGRGAAAGGVTTVIEMPQGDPPSVTGQTYRRKIELASRDAVVDFALWGGAIPGRTTSDLAEMLAAGAVGFKAFTCNSDPGYPGLDDAQLLRTLEFLKGTPVMLGLHAENDALLQRGLAEMQEAGRIDPLAHAESRPPIVEMEAVNRAIFFAEQTGGWAHIVHMSSAGSAELVRLAKLRGVRITCETCPHYLTLDLEDLVRLGPFAKCAPAIRSREEVDGLWRCVADGVIDCLTSDHCAFTAEVKESGRENIFDAPNGLAGIQTLLPVFASEARRRGISWERIAEMTAGGPARLWRLAPKKGAVRAGADADLTLFDPDAEWVVNKEELLHTQKWSPFEGREVRGRVVRTLLRGETVYQIDLEERVPVGLGFGRFVPRQDDPNDSIAPGVGTSG